MSAQTRLLENVLFNRSRTDGRCLVLGGIIPWVRLIRWVLLPLRRIGEEGIYKEDCKAETKEDSGENEYPIRKVEEYFQDH
jgi:hypothetical protein